MSGDLTTNGVLDRNTYVQLSYQIHQQRIGGILRLNHGNRIREIFYTAGEPVLYRTSLPEEQLSKSLLFGNLISKSKLSKVLDRVDDKTTLEELLLKSRLLQRAQLDRHLLGRLQKGIGAPLHWSSGTWEFQLHPELAEVHIDLELLPRLSTLNCLWLGVKKYISVDAVMEMVRSSTGQRGPTKIPKRWSTTPELENRISSFELEAPFDRIADALTENCGPDEIISKVNDSSGNLVKLLWLLETIGLLKVVGVQPDHTIMTQLQFASSPQTPTETQATKQEGEAEAPPSPKKKKPKKRANATAPPSKRGLKSAATSSKKSAAEVLHADYQARQNCNFYQFIGLQTNASTAEIETACKRLAQRWRSAANAHQLDENSRRQAKQLLDGVRQAWTIFKDGGNRSGYDKELESGRATQVHMGLATTTKDSIDDLPGGSDAPSSLSFLERGKALIESKHFQPAWQVLERARQENPSCPDTLAAIGWAAYHVKHSSQLDEEPEDFLKLALTFDRHHTEALEYSARISLKKGNLERAETFLRELVKQRPDASWAQRELSQIQSAQSRDSGRRFWRKGDDG